MPLAKTRRSSFALAFIVAVVFPTVFVVGDDLGTEVPLHVQKIRAFTLDPDDGTEIMLAMPSYEKCIRRMNNALSIGDFTFWVSNNDPSQVTVDPDTNEKFNKTYTWVEARNECRKKCMDLVALDDPSKNKCLQTILKSSGISTGVWTAGKRCLFDECARVPEPVHLNGWYWVTTEANLHPADLTEPGWPENPWGDSGIMDAPQPDNAENFKDKTVIEACLAVKTSPKNLKPAWHDVACDRKLGIVCEPAPELLKFIESNHGVMFRYGLH
ncbi:C-type lectin fold [Trinorchestia longiramus]|nr:C-type lectin fold [Trinorchestia longiramus]